MNSTHHDQELSEAVGRVLGFLAGVTLEAADLYLARGLSHASVPDDDRQAILRGLLAVATAFRVADVQSELLDQMTDELDPKPALAVLRVVQDSLTLALSDDPRDRSHRITEKELRSRLQAGPVTRFLDMARTR